MSAGQRRLLRVATLLAGGSGVAYAVMRYLVPPADEWAVVNHPWQPHVQHLHVLTGPLLVFAVAYVWREHAAARLAAPGRRGRLFGRAMMLLFAPMVATGLLAQVAVAEGWRDAWRVAHLVLGLLWLTAAIGHAVAARVGVGEAAEPASAAPRGPLIAPCPATLPARAVAKVEPPTPPSTG